MVDMLLLVFCRERGAAGGGGEEDGGVGTTRKEAMEADIYCCVVPAASNDNICVLTSSKIWASTPPSISDGSNHANKQYKRRTAVRRVPSTETAT